MFKFFRNPSPGAIEKLPDGFRPSDFETALSEAHEFHLRTNAMKLEGPNLIVMEDEIRSKLYDLQNLNDKITEEISRLHIQQFHTHRAINALRSSLEVLLPSDDSGSQEGMSFEEIRDRMFEPDPELTEQGWTDEEQKRAQAASDELESLLSADAVSDEEIDNLTFEPEEEIKP